MYYMPFYPYYRYAPVCPYQQQQMFRQNAYKGSWHPPQGSELTDFGGNPFVININGASKQNTNYRTTIWTGDHLQVTVMSLNIGEDVGLEVHDDVDQFLRIEQGQGLVQMGDAEDQLSFEQVVFDDDAIMVPAGKWHNLTNSGNVPLKLYSIYAPPEHPFGATHVTKQEAMKAEE